MDQSTSSARFVCSRTGLAVASLLLILSLAAPSLALRTAPDFGHPACENDAVQALEADGGSLVVDGDVAACFRVYLPSSGLWLVHGDGAELSLYPAGCDSAADGLAVVRKAAHELLLRSDQRGDRVVCAIPAGDARSYRVTSRFEGSTEPTIGDLPETGFGKRARVARKSRVVDALCADRGDDHGDSLTCATPLHLRYTTDLRTKQEPDPDCSEPDPDPRCRQLGSIIGSIDHRVGGDVDIYSFDVADWSTLRTRLRSSVGGVAFELLDSVGRTLSASPDTGLHLAPGQYALRIASPADATGSYALDVEIEDAP